MFIQRFSKKNPINKCVFVSICIIIFVKLSLLLLSFLFILCVVAYGVYYSLGWIYAVDVIGDYLDENMVYVFKWLPEQVERTEMMLLHGEDTQAGYPLYYLQFESFSKYHNYVYM